jgi:hypothetical protein
LDIDGWLRGIGVQALAEPGTVLVTARVQRQIAGLFVAEERGSHELKGVPEPVTRSALGRPRVQRWLPSPGTRRTSSLRRGMARPSTAGRVTTRRLRWRPRSAGCGSSANCSGASWRRAGGPRSVARAGGEDWRLVSPTRLRARLPSDPGGDDSRAEMARRFPPPWSVEESGGRAAQPCMLLDCHARQISFFCDFFHGCSLLS